MGISFSPMALKTIYMLTTPKFVSIIQSYSLDADSYIQLPACSIYLVVQDPLNWTCPKPSFRSSSSNLFRGLSHLVNGSQVLQFLKPETVTIFLILFCHMNHRKLCQLYLQIISRIPSLLTKAPQSLLWSTPPSSLAWNIQQPICGSLPVSTLALFGLISIKESEWSFFNLKLNPIILLLKYLPMAPPLTQPKCGF